MMIVRRLPRCGASCQVAGGTAHTVGTSKRRSGVVLLGVLIVIVVLALIAYQFSDRMTAEYVAATNAHRYAQVRAFAASGAHYAAAVLANPDNAGMIDSGIYDSDIFRDIALPDSEGKGNGGRFTLVAPADPTDGGAGSYRAGVVDESGKININAMMKIDPSGTTLEDMLKKLPNMTPEIAASIVYWADPQAATREGAADSGYYQGLQNPYRAKNAPLDSLDELLLVRGVTRELLYGSDLNHNNLPDGNETGAGSGIDRGWSSFLTVWSREVNRDAHGLPLAYINDPDLPTLYQKLAAVADDDMAKFIVMYRQYGSSTSTGGQSSVLGSIASLLGGGKTAGKSGSGSTSNNTVAGTLGSYTPDFSKKGSRQIATLYNLIGTQVSIQSKDANGKSITTIYSSPLNDPQALGELFTKLWLGTTTSKDAELPARINVLTAPPEVLAALPVLTDGDVQTILNARPKLSSADAQTDIYKTPAWLMAAAALKPATLTNIDKYVTARSSVYSMQVVGYFENKQGPTARVEAVVDTTFGRPRFIYWRDWTELGKTKVPNVTGN